jgi:hypothetical protein
LESQIQRRVVEFARHRGVIARKLSFGEGWPDYMFLWKGAILFIEFKRPGERPGPLQVYVIDLIRKQGFEVILVDNLIDGRKAIRRFVGEPDSS